MKHNRQIILLAILSSISWLCISLLGNINRFPIVFILLYLSAFFLYVRAILVILQKESSVPLALILLPAILFRIAVLYNTPSTDVNRYLWEGMIQREGFNPYKFAPSEPALARYQVIDPYYSSINHNDWAAIYPPLSLMWFRLVSLVSYTPLAMKISFLFVETIAVYILLLILKERNVSQNRVLIYAWNPLSVLSIGLEGHYESLYIAPLILSFYYIGKRDAWVAISFALSLTAKFFALAITPVLIIAMRTRAWILVLFVVGIIYMPFINAKEHLFKSFFNFGFTLHYNDSLHALVGLVLNWQPFTRVLMATLWLAFTVWVLYRERDTLKQSALCIAAMLLAMPTVHIWYILVIVPFLCFFPWQGWIALTGTCVLVYLAQIEIFKTGQWVEWHWVKIPEYLPLFIWLVRKAVKRSKYSLVGNRV